MQMCSNMHWAPTLLRKFSSTGHFRLLNQLRGDLRKRPLDRDPVSGSLKMPGSSRFSRQGPGRNPTVDSRFAKSPQPVVSAQATVQQTAQAPTEQTVQTQTTSPSTFRERLSAIDMR